MLSSIFRTLAICKKISKKVQHEAEELKMQLLHQDHYSRRENLMFVGIEENDTPVVAENESANNKCGEYKGRDL